VKKHTILYWVSVLSRTVLILLADGAPQHDCLHLVVGFLPLGYTGMLRSLAAAVPRLHVWQLSPTNHFIVAPSRQATSFTHAFAASFAVMVVSEIGDKTFFIAAIMAMQ